MQLHGATEDDALAAGIRAADPGVFQRLCEASLVAARARAHRRLGATLRRRLDAADVVQEALLVAFRRRRAFVGRDAAGFRNWLLGIVDRTSARALRCHVQAARRTLSRECDPDTGPGAEPVSWWSGPVEHLLRAEDVARVRVAWRRLSATHRRVLHLTLLEDHSLERTARLLGRTREAVKKLAQRARRRLRDAVTEAAPGGAGRGPHRLSD